MLKTLKDVYYNQEVDDYQKFGYVNNFQYVCIMEEQNLINQLCGYKDIQTLDSSGNQFVITFNNGEVFVSYGTIIVIKFGDDIYLTGAWRYSKTTSKYRNIYLNEDASTTQTKISNGTYKFI